MNLGDSIEKNFRLTEAQKKALKRLKISSIKDLLFYFPERYSAISELHFINELTEGENATILGKIIDAKTKKSFKSKIPMGEATLEDPTGKIKIVWFNQAYLAKMFVAGDIVQVSGKVSLDKKGEKTLTNPEIKKTPLSPIDLHSTLFYKEESLEAEVQYPIYRETRGITSKWIYHTIEKIVSAKVLDEIQEYIPEEILTRYKLPSLKTALIWIHLPKKEADAIAARKRFAFEEVFFIQLGRHIDRKNWRENKTYEIEVDQELQKKFEKNFGFSLTEGQNKVINDIFSDIEKDSPMSRLLEGDVGSGKTAVAASITKQVVSTRPPGQKFGNLQVAYMAPTEILARQLFDSFTEYFKNDPIQVGLITGSGARKFPSKVYGEKSTNISRPQLQKWVKNGEIPVLIGTHTLIQKSVEFRDLALVIIDEQHRFGTNQRASLAKKSGFAPHLLSMTATPIPRTLALTIYGDLDLSVLDQMPMGRKSVVTEIVKENDRDEAYEKIKEELENGRQLYVICPRIDEPDETKEKALQVKSVTTETRRLKKNVFPDYNIEYLHSKMTKEKKEKTMERFLNKEIDILVSTSVIEVGINVPNASVMIIEGAERFGLAQLHQLRGRIMRGTHQPYCYLFADVKSDKTLERMKAIKEAKNGFELAEIDLAQRGMGMLSGEKQWGLSDLGMEAIKNIKMVEAAREEAKKIVEEDKLESYTKLKTELEKRDLKIHFE
ncbi:ATP-dependent DNA helicase RecG [Candidatus Nomurabacteria bacterium]|nr:ATP-dependent DNA helicase RecG [Candidatus Nomurabacteria bacterium]USN94516.1 MAG: ATP-dependent DNA helicase RecG [Candidatus Nomurabacteria bacterium]